MEAAPAAIPEKPKIAAITATTKNIPAHFNIGNNFIGQKIINAVKAKCKV